jgi:uncharacterized membrane protein YkvA (DUF1232 family)
MNSTFQSALRPMVLAFARRFRSSERLRRSSAEPQRRLKSSGLSALFGVLAVIYTLWPMDLIPDVIPFLGWLDDGLALFFAFQQARKVFRGRETANSN